MAITGITSEESPILTQEELEKFSPKEEDEIKVETASEQVAVVDDTPRKYVKISPTFHVMYLTGDTENEIYRIFNPQTGIVEERPLTDIEKHEIQVKEYKELRTRFRNVRHEGNITTVKFGAAYKQERKRKNRQQKASRRLARKK